MSKFNGGIVKTPLKLGHGWIRLIKWLGPSDAIWRQRSRSILAMKMACYLTAPNQWTPMSQSNTTKTVFSETIPYVYGMWTCNHCGYMYHALSGNRICSALPRILIILMCFRFVRYHLNWPTRFGAISTTDVSIAYHYKVLKHTNIVNKYNISIRENRDIFQL